MQQFMGTSLKTRLYLMVLAAFVPVSFLIYYVAEEQKESEKQAILRKTLVLARAAANEENLQLESAQNFLVALSDAFVLMADHPEKLAGLLTNLLKQSKGYEEFGILDPSGRVLVDSNPPRMGQDYSGKIWFTSFIKNKRMTLGQYQGEHIDGEPVIYLALPVTNDQHQITAAVFAAINLNWMNRTIFQRLAELPKESQLLLLDEFRGILNYNVAQGKWSIPEEFDSALHQQIVLDQSGTLKADDTNGTPQLFAFAPLDSSFRGRRIFVVLELPYAIAFSSANRIFIRNMALLALSAALAAYLIWWAGDYFILRRITTMVQATRRLAEGDLATRIGNIGARDELAHLAGVFDEMAAALQVRLEHERQIMNSLAQSKEQFRNLAAYQQEVLEQERTRIAREIHDQFGQSLTLLKMDLSWLKKHLPKDIPQADEKMADMADVINEALKNLHAVTSELRPVILDDFGLAAAIEWQIELFRNRSGIDSRLENNGFEPDLPKGHATALFRIFQEALTNILRHAMADKVVVRLEMYEKELLLGIQDNGRGIKESHINDPKSYGLLGMRERLHPLNGRVTFEGKPGEGTQVTVKLPMP